MAASDPSSSDADKLAESDRVARRGQLAWRFSFWGGLLMGVCLLLILVLPDTAYAKDDVQIACVFVGLFVFLCAVVLPALVAGFAHKHPTLMGCVPLLIALAFLCAAEVFTLTAYPTRGNIFKADTNVDKGAPGWDVCLFMAAVAWIVTAGPVSVWRWVAGKVAKRRLAHAERKLAATEVIEGSWPPKPRS
ncbi:MAG TPA: hypothetical protein VGK19_21855 [Capsulimonadaceae bacterium]|jgi:hypothetical protein